MHSDSPVSYQDYWVDFVDLGGQNQVYRAGVQFDGSFQLREIGSGSYTLRVTTLEGVLIHQELVNVSPQCPPVTVRLPASPATHSAPGTISLTQLRHPPARKAYQAAASAQRFSASGQIEKAAAELEKAIRISPEYADAYNNLAVQHIRMGRFEDACGELARAMAIAGPNPVQRELSAGMRKSSCR